MAPIFVRVFMDSRTAFISYAVTILLSAVAVRSHNPNVDAIGTIVGRGGANIKKITSKFHPAKYDAKSDRMIPIEEKY